jgi:hypothetical protein
MERPLWADLHNHNAVGYGRGGLDRSYEIARGVLLDAYCFTPHGLWHDMPGNDPRMVEFHRAGFELVKKNWGRVRARAEAENRDGEFAALLGFEWHSSEFGDYHVIFPGGEGEVCAAGSLRELSEFCRRTGAIMIPHHLGYRRGWRGANWEGADAALTPVVEVFSEHGCSMESEFNAPMVLHSMGGVERSQTFMSELSRGRVAGVVASTDNHWGHPASYGEGLAGIWADRASREAVFAALAARHTYALTGDRIFLKVEMAEGMMGDCLDACEDRALRCSVGALGEIDYVRVIKNGRVAKSVPTPGPRRDAESVFTLRVDFGWGAMTAEEVTDWLVGVRVSGGRIDGVCPCFAGGGGSTEKVNRVTRVTYDEVGFEAFTSRANSRAQSGLVLRVEGDGDTRIEVEGEALWRGSKCGCRLGAALGELLTRDEWSAISEVFSAPRMRLGGCHGAGQTDLDFEWTDPDPGESDWYLVKVLQKNGQAAWSSPIYCRTGR